MKPILNIAEVELRGPPSEKAPRGANAGKYDIRRGEIASRIGARKLGYNLTVVAPDKTNCPFHNHYAEEEMFFVLEGTGELRYGDKTYPVKPGDVIACPTGGPDTAHQIINTGSTEMRYLSISTLAEVEVCDYPDSGKFGVYADHTGSGTVPYFRYLGREEDAHDYWEGE